jgi:hypothetical protein
MKILLEEKNAETSKRMFPLIDILAFCPDRVHNSVAHIGLGPLSLDDYMLFPYTIYT